MRCFKIGKDSNYSGSKPRKLPIRICVFEWVIQAIPIPVKPDLALSFQLFNDPDPAVCSKNVITSKVQLFSFQLNDMVIYFISSFSYFPESSIEKRKAGFILTGQGILT